jgi:Protein of unknown function (DUF3631)/RepB DNA-primase from phage plasmid
MANINHDSARGNTTNAAYTELFLRKLAPDTDQFSYQTFTDNAAKRDHYKLNCVRDPFARVLHGSLADQCNTLMQLSAAGAGIYIVVNETDFRGRATANVVRVRAYFVDLDGADPRNLLRLRLRPHLVTETSPGHYHAYWLVAGATLEQFKSVQQRLAKPMGGDRSVCDLSRVMRLPGFLPQKDPAHPFLVTVGSVESGPPYSDLDFQAALAEAEAPFATSNNKRRDQTDSSSPPDMRQGYPDGHRTRELTVRAGWCLGPWNMSEDEAVTACLEWNKYNAPPLSEEKVRSTIASIAKAETAKRRGANSQRQQGYGDESQRDSEQAALIDELARLDPIPYDRRREKAAEQLGIRVTALDEAVKQRRAKLAGEAEEQPLFAHWDVKPWPEPVDGDALVLALVRRIRSNVVMTAEAALTVALWVIFTWAHAEAAVHSPILVVTSPEAECGKTTLLGIIGFLVRRALASVGISAAVLYRSIEKWRPTIVVDEADVAFVQNEDLRAVVNSGWTRDQGVLRCEGDEHEPRLFLTFCPKTIGLKGKKLPDTTASRAIVIELKRKLADENVEDFRHIDDPGLQELRQKLLRWAVDNVGALESARPTLPDGFTNRVAANWNLLLAIADIAGGEWPEKAREAAAGIAKLKATLNATIGVQLLTDIRTILGEKDCMFSATLIAILADDPEGSWAEYNRGKRITQKQLANLLRGYGIVSETVWISGHSAKGYKRAAFEDVWTRYLPE